jgi:hypothetical protein
MTVLEQRFLERVPRELSLLNKNIEELINILKDGNDTRKRLQDADHIL